MIMPKQYQRMVGSKWTSKTSLRGWRHFEVVELRAVEGGYDALLVATCDAENVRPRVQAKQLFDRELWTPGWTPLAQLVLQEEEATQDG